MAPGAETKQQKRLARGLRPGPSIPGHRIQCDERTHTWVIDDLRVTCTPITFACLRLLLEQAGKCVPFARLIAQFPGKAPVDPASYTARMKLRRLVSGLRARLWPLDMDIVSIMGVGYLLLCLQEEEETLHTVVVVRSQEGDS